ncbi:hypothetical protein [Paracholeplasma brassicae]|uniref:hypothetical protein n=1 Tax=Acholeplasma brassicae TaxID=61635 RepID=UPI0012FEFA4E|nr:hypothetical protein [Paracholeplasma brassicae]
MNQDLFEIERETISRGESMLSFKLKVYGVHRFIRKLRWLNVLRRVIKWLLRRS